MADIFTEVDEDLRREKLEKAWKKFAPYIITASVLFVGGIGFNVWWQDHQASERALESDSYQRALESLEGGQEAAALEALQRLGQQSKHGYELLSRLQAAAVLARDGKTSEALATYDSISADGSAEKIYQDYAALMAGILELDMGQVDAARARLEPLTADDNAWKHSANELLGLLAIQEEEWVTAETIFLGLSLNEAVPEELQARAREYLQIVDVRKPQMTLNTEETLAEGEEPVAQEESGTDGTEE